MNTVTSKDGVTIAFDVAGEGPAIILVDGAMATRTAGAMTPLVPFLASHFTVYTYDRRGRGDSTDTAPYAIEREIEDLDALITKAGGSAFVYGISSGAALALEAARRGLAITRLALYEPPFIVDETRPPVPSDFLVRIKELVASERRGDAIELFMTKGVEVPAEMVAEMRQTPMWPAMESIAHTLPYDLTIMEGTEYGKPLPTERVTAVTIPVLVMAGGASPMWLLNAAQAVADAIPGAQYRTLEGQTHGVAPDAIAPSLVEFFAS